MSNVVKSTTGGGLVVQTVFSPDEIALLRETYAKDLNDTELQLFLKQAAAQELNPFTKEIYGLKVGGRLVLITGIGGFRKMAHKSGTYLGLKQTVEMDGKIPVKCTTFIKKKVGNDIAEFESEVLFSEYTTGQNNWAKMPVTMIKKVSEVHAIRMAGLASPDVFEESELGSIERDQKRTERTRDVTAAIADLPPAVKVDHPNQEYDPGDFMVNIGSRKNSPCKLKDIPPEEIIEYIAWADAQEKLPVPAKTYLRFAKQYIEKNS